MCHIFGEPCSAKVGFHTSGISACFDLQRLVCSHGLIGAAQDAETTDFAVDHFIVLRSLSAVTAITSLHIVFDSESMPVEQSWLGHLPSLQSINLLLSSPFVSLPASISQLT